MFWIVLLLVLAMAGIAFDLVSFCMSPERIVMTINIGNLTPTIRRWRDVALMLSPRRNDSHSERDSHD